MAISGDPGLVSDPIGRGSAADAAWDRIAARLEVVFREIEQIAAKLLDRELSIDDRERAGAAARRVASWLGHLGLLAAAELSRHLAALWERDSLHAGSAVEAAGLIEELRSQLGHAASDLPAVADDAPRVTVVGPSTAVVDSAVWVAASSGLRVHLSEAGLDSPSECDAIVVFCQSAAAGVDTVVARGLAERLAGTPLLAIADAPSIRDRRALGRVAAVVLDGDTPPRDVVEELGRVCARPTGSEVVAVMPLGDSTIPELLNHHGVPTVPVTDADELVAVLRRGEAGGVVLPARLTADEAVSMTQLVRSHPRIRTAAVVVETHTDDASTRVRHFRAGANDVIGSVGADELAARIKAALVRRAALLPFDVDASHRRLLSWTRSRILIDRLLTSSQRRGHVSSVAVVTTEDDVPDEVPVDERYELLQSAFRDGDVVGRRSCDQIVIALSGAPRRVAATRIADMLGKLRLAESHRVGVAEFPFDGKNVEELARAAEEAAVRSRGAGGPMVVATDWQPDDELAPEVVIVDPDVTLASVLAVALERHGHRTIHFQDGGEALDHLVGPDRRPLPRVVLLEFDTPGIEGLQLLRRLAEHGALSRVRVLMLTARTQEADLRQAFELGAADVVRKPFPAALMLQRLRRTLEQ